MSISAAINALTTFFGFKKINFDYPRWHTEEWSNWDLLDSILKGLGATSVRGPWVNSTAYLVGDRVIDANGTVYECGVIHTSAALPTTFAQDRAANPTYWHSISLTISDINGLQAALDNKYNTASISSFIQTVLDDTDAATARSTLGVVVGQTSGTFAAGDDSRFASISGVASGALQKANNLSDLPSAATARFYLGLGTLATMSSLAISDIANLTSTLNGKLSTGGGTVTGTLTVDSADIYTYRAGGTTGFVFLSSDGSRYIYNDGTNYNLNGQDVWSGNPRRRLAYINEVKECVDSLRLLDAGTISVSLGGELVTAPAGSFFRGCQYTTNTLVFYCLYVQYNRPNYGWVTIG